MDLESDPDVPASPSIRLSEEIRGVNGFLVRTWVPCEDPSKILEAVPLPSPSDSLSEEDEGVVPGPFEVSLAHKPCSSSYLDDSSRTGWLWCSRKLRMKPRRPLAKSSLP